MSLPKSSPNLPTLPSLPTPELPLGWPAVGTVGSVGISAKLISAARAVGTPEGRDIMQWPFFFALPCLIFSTLGRTRPVLSLGEKLHQAIFCNAHFLQGVDGLQVNLPFPFASFS